MRRIVITVEIRKYANCYKELFEAKCKNVVKDLEKLRDNVLKYNEWENKEAVEGYFNQLIADYPMVLTLEPKDWDFNSYKTFIDKEPHMLKREVIYDFTKEKKKSIASTKPKKGKLYERIMFCLRYTEARKILAPIHFQMKLNACVYCNTQYTVCSPDGEVFYEMDHFKAQSEYPFLGTCFFNLQPSDSACNKRKSTASCDFQLFVNDKYELSPFKFVPQITECKNFKDSQNIVIKFVNQDGTYTAKTEEYDKTFHISKLYSAYTKIPADIFWRNQQCARLGQVQNYIKGLEYEPTRDEISSYCLGCAYSDDLIHEEPLRKLKVDTMHLLEENGLLNI